MAEINNVLMKRQAFSCYMLLTHLPLNWFNPFRFQIFICFAEMIVPKESVVRG